MVNATAAGQQISFHPVYKDYFLVTQLTSGFMVFSIESSGQNVTLNNGLGGYFGAQFSPTDTGFIVGLQGGTLSVIYFDVFAFTLDVRSSVPLGNGSALTSGKVVIAPDGRTCVVVAGQYVYLFQISHCCGGAGSSNQQPSLFAQQQYTNSSFGTLTEVVYYSATAFVVANGVDQIIYFMTIDATLSTFAGVPNPVNYGCATMKNILLEPYFNNLIFYSGNSLITVSLANATILNNVSFTAFGVPTDTTLQAFGISNDYSYIIMFFGTTFVRITGGNFTESESPA